MLYLQNVKSGMLEIEMKLKRMDLVDAYYRVDVEKAEKTWSEAGMAGVIVQK